MNRAARLILPALSLAGLGLLSGGCGSADSGGSSAGPETTGTTAQSLTCPNPAGLLHAEACFAPIPTPPIHIKPFPPPVLPIQPIAPDFPATVACGAGETCWFYTSPDDDLTGIPCSPAHQFMTTNSTTTSGYAVSYCNTVGTGASQVQSWIAANPSAGASLVHTALDGLAAPPAGYGFLIYDTNPVGPAFPTPLACPAGDDCSNTGIEEGWSLSSLPCSATWTVDDGVDSWYFAAYCSTAGHWGADVTAFASTKLFGGSTASVYPGLPPAQAGYVYVQYYPKNIGVHCDTCGGDGAGGSSSGGGSGSSSGGAPVQQQ